MCYIDSERTTNQWSTTNKQTKNAEHKVSMEKFCFGSLSVSCKNYTKILLVLWVVCVFAFETGGCTNTLVVICWNLDLLLYTFDLKTFNVSCLIFPWGYFLFVQLLQFIGMCPIQNSCKNVQKQIWIILLKNKSRSLGPKEKKQQTDQELSMFARFTWKIETFSKQSDSEQWQNVQIQSQFAANVQEIWNWCDYFVFDCNNSITINFVMQTDNLRHRFASGQL